MSLARRWAETASETPMTVGMDAIRGIKRTIFLLFSFVLCSDFFLVLSWLGFFLNNDRTECSRVLD